MTEAEIKALDPIGKWEPAYRDPCEPQPYGPTVTYELAAKFLDDGNWTEDWGCGYAYARRYFKNSVYYGVDGTKSQHCDEVDDLRTRKSSPPNILLRGILEHNMEWKKLLANVTHRAQKKLCIIFFMDFVSVQTKPHIDKNGIPTFQLCEKEVMELMGGWNIKKETVKEAPDSIWHVWYCTRKSS